MTTEIEVKSREDIIKFIENNTRRAWNATLLLIAAIGGIFVDGYDTGAVSFGLSTIIPLFHLTPLETTLVGSFVALGSIIGGYFASLVLDKLGRRVWFVITLLVFIVGAIVSALAVNAAMLYIGRLLLGFGIGMDYAVAFSYIPEVSNRFTKARNANFQQFMFFGGLMVAGAIGIAALVLGAGLNYWRWILGSGAIFAAIFLTLRQIYIIESPMWLAYYAPIDEAIRTLELTYNVKVRISEEDRKKLESPLARREQVKMSELFSKIYRRITWAITFLAIFQGFEYYGVIFYFPLIMTFLFPHAPLITTLWESDVYYAIGFGVGGGMAFIVHKLGLKRTIIIGAIVVFLSAFLIGVLGPILGMVFIAVALGFYIAGHAFGPGPNYLTLASMAYPTYIRGRANGYAYMTRSIGAFFGYFAMPMLKPILGLSNTLLVISIFPIVVIISTLLVPYEPLRIDVESYYIEKLKGEVRS